MTWRSPSAFAPPSTFALRGIGYGPLSDSSAYWKETATRFWALPTVVTGMPIGTPLYVPDPKSACTPAPAPIEATMRAEPAATGSLSTRWFHGLLRGKTWQRAAPRTGRPALVAARPSRRVAITAAATARMSGRGYAAGRDRPMAG